MSITTPYIPQFGHGAPGAGLNTAQPYFDRDTNPYTEYVFNGGAWHASGAAGVGTNATSIQGVPVSATAPTNGQILQDVGGVWTPQPNSGTPGAVVVQSALNGDIHSNGVTFAGAPTAGNVVVAICSDTLSSPTINSAAGWFLLGEAGAAQDGFGIAMKIVTPGDTALQEPFNDTHQGVTAVWEISNGSWGLYVINFNYAATTTPAINYNNSKTAGGLVVGLVVPRNTGITATAISSGAVIDKTASFAGIGRSGTAWHVAAPASGIGAGTVTVTNAGAATAGLNMCMGCG